MADTPMVNPIHAAVAALKSGADIEQAVYGTSSSTPTEDNAVKLREPKPEVQVQDGPDSESSSEHGDGQVKVEDANSSPSAKAVAKATSQKPDGKQAAPAPDKVKALEQGMRKFQSERDALSKAKAALEKEHSDLKSHWSGLEEAFQNEGIAGVINLIAGDKEAYKKQVESEYERRKAREGATPAQKQAMDLEERFLQEQKARERTEKKFKELEGKVTTEREQAEQKSLESVVNPIFEKYRFTGKLGDDEAEYYYDKALWREAVENLDKLPEEQITREAMETEFKKVASAYRKVINSQADKTVKKTIETKKAHAQESAAAKAMSGMSTSAATDEFRTNIRSGNITDAFRQLLSGKVKLS